MKKLAHTVRYAAYFDEGILVEKVNQYKTIWNNFMKQVDNF